MALSHANAWLVPNGMEKLVNQVYTKNPDKNSLTMSKVFFSVKRLSYWQESAFYTLSQDQVHVASHITSSYSLNHLVIVL